MIKSLNTTLCKECPATGLQKQVAELAAKITDLEARQRLEYQSAHADFNDLFERLGQIDAQLTLEVVHAQS